jgi:localization factor PodJL
MNKALSWRIKGVDFDAREAAMEAARRSGKSLGEWLNTVIAEQAAADGVSEDDYDSKDRLDAVTRRLQHLGDRRVQHTGDRRDMPARRGEGRNRDLDDTNNDDGGERRQTARRDATLRDVPREPSRDSRRENPRDNPRDLPRDLPRETPTRDRPSRDLPRDLPRSHGEPAWQPNFNPEALLENAIAAFDRRAQRSNERAARALSDVAELIETSHQTRRRDDTALASISERLAQIERRVTRAAETNTARPLRDALERLEARIETLARRPAPAPEPAPSPRDREPQVPAAGPTDARIAEIEARLAALNAAPAAAKRPLATMIAEVARRQRELDGDAPMRPAPLPVTPVPVAPVPVAKAEPVVPPQAVPTATELRLSALIERLEKAAAAPVPAPIADLSGLQGNLSTLTERVEQMRGEIAARAAARAAENDQIAQIRREIVGMSREITGLAPRASIAALDSAMRDMAMRIENSRQKGVGDAVLAPVESLMRDVHSVLKEIDPRASVASVNREIRQIASKLEKFDGSQAIDPATIRGIFEQTREVRDILHHVLASQRPSERVEKELAALAGRIEAMAASGINARDNHELADRVSEIRNLIADPSLHGRALQAVEAQLESVARRIDTALGERFETMQRAFAAELSQVRSANAMPADVVTQLGDRLDTMQRTFAAELSRMRSASTVPANLVLQLGERLETVQRAFAAELSQVRSANSVPADFVAQLGERFDAMQRAFAAELSHVRSANSVPVDVVAQLGDRLDTMQRTFAAELGHVRSANSVPVDVVAQLGERLDAMQRAFATELSHVHSANVVPFDVVAQLGDRLDAMQRAFAAELSHVRSANSVPVDLVAQIGERFETMQRAFAAELSHVHSANVVPFDLVAQLGDRLDAMQQAFAAELSQVRSAHTVPVDVVTQLSERIDTALGNGLLAMQRAISRAFTKAAEQPAEPDPHLESMMNDLVARIDAATAARADDGAIAALQGQIERMSGMFDRTGKTTETLAALEHSVADLFTRLDENRQSSIEAAEAAVRRVARANANGHDDIASEFGREIADLRSVQDSTDHRTHETLNAVHETLERVVERLATLEDDLADVRETRTPRLDAPLEKNSADQMAEIARALQAEQERHNEQRTERRREPPMSDDAAPEVLIEPGAPFAGRRARAVEPDFAEAHDDRLEYRPQASFIQAARRAAQAAAAAAPDAAVAAPKKTAASNGSAVAAPLEQVRAYYETRKRPILLSLAALMVLVGAWQIGRAVVDERLPEPPTAIAPKISMQPPSDANADKPADAPVQAPAPALAKPAEAPASAPAVAVPPTPAPTAAPDRKAENSAAPTMSLPMSAIATSNAPLDRAPVGSIATAQPNVDTNGIVRAMAVQGDPAAQFELAVRYSDGRLLARDLKLASEWFQKAAAKGLAPAQYRLAAMYERGVGIPRDAAQAKLWYQRAADQGNARAMHNLAVLHADSSSGKPDYSGALGWFLRAAELGVRDSQFNLAILYARGLGTSVDFVQSYLWFAAAAAQGDDDAAKKRDDVTARLSPADLARAKALFAAFTPKPLDAAANDVAPPPGGWEAVKTVPRNEPKAESRTSRPKVSNL